MKETCAGSQTVGPFFRIGLEHLCAQPDAPPSPDALTIHGRVLDGAGHPVPDALLELWSADHHGKYATQAPDPPQWAPPGFVRVASDEAGCFRFHLLKPGQVDMGDGRMQAPHAVVLVFARGLLRHLITRMYFPGEAANDADPVLQSIPPERRATLIPQQDPANPASLQWHIRLQGEEETVFFAW